MDKFIFIYWLSNVIVIMSLFVAIRFYKRVRVGTILVLLFLVITSLHWDYYRMGSIDDALYDISFMFVSIALVACGLRKNSAK